MAFFRSVLGQSLLSITLAAVCMACYALIVILYLKPSLYHIESLTNPDRKNIKPTVAVSLLALVLNTATVTLVTRCVEHSLWTKLAKEPKSEDFRGVLTIGETRRLAQWSTSTLERLTYVFGGFAGPDKRSWLLRISGPLLVATATVGPVLLVGITESSVQLTSTTTVPRTADPWLSRMDTGNERYRGGNSFDNPTFIAALASMRNLSAPVAPLCQDTNARSTCSVSAQTVAIQATCTGRSESNPDNVGTIFNGIKNSTFCTGQDTERELCVELQASSPATYSVFKTGLPACSTSNLTDCPAGGIDGQWAKIFGAWVNGVDITANSDHRINFVDCDLTYGNITVTQNGTSPPLLDRSSYVRSTSKNASQYGFTNLGVSQFNRIYTELGNSPYDWKLAAVGRGSNTIYSTPVAFLLLGQDANNDAETVARTIEQNFDMATLHGFARGTTSSNIVFTRTEQRPVYVYNKEVLLILLVPLVATLLGSWARWRVAGDDVNVGYDPVGIARLGPVAGLAHGSPPTDDLKEKEDSFKVWRWTRESTDQYQQGVRVTGLQAYDTSLVITREEHGMMRK